MSKKKIKNIISFSGGKDSTALLLWARENLTDFDAVYMDTGFEHQITYDYINRIDKELIGGKLIRLKSSKYDGFEDLAMKKGRVPSTKARFCTTELKLKPLKEYIDKIRDDFEIFNYVGIRADESFARSKMKYENFDLDYFGVWIRRPLLEWSAADVFAIHEKYGIEPNPLYKMGMKRVGCMPCIMSNHRDFKAIMASMPDVIEKIKKIESDVGRSFFPPNYIPKRFQSMVDEKSGRKYPSVQDVIDYLNGPDNQTEMFDREMPSCISHFNLCE